MFPTIARSVRERAYGHVSLGHELVGPMWLGFHASGRLELGRSTTGVVARMVF